MPPFISSRISSRIATICSISFSATVNDGIKCSESGRGALSTIPDRLGNGRLDTFENLLTNPEITVFFLIADNCDTVRIIKTLCRARR
jgi:hypothetical protein